MLKVGSKFYTFDELSKRLEEFQQLEKVQLWVRDSRTVVAAAKRARRKSLNPALKYAELTYSCVFGGRRPSDQTKTHNQTSAGGCPFKVRLSTSIDGQALVVKEICHDHNHEPGKKLHEEPRRLYKKTPNRTSVRKPVRYIVNKQRVSSSENKNNKTRLENSESHIQLGQSPFHHLHLHQQQYQQQQQQIKLQLQQHLQQQQQQQLQIRQRQAEVIQLDSPDHIDTPDHLSSPDLSTTFDQLGSLNNSVDQYAYLPPSPISPSLSSGCLVDCEEDERLEPILDLEEALEEALGDLDSVGSMEVDANLRLSTLGSSTPTLGSQSEVQSTDDHTGPPPAKRQRGRPRKQSFTGTPPKGEKAERDHSGESKESEASANEEGDFVGFSQSMEKNKAEGSGLCRADVAQANAMARQLHVYKPGIDFVPGARLEVLDARDNNWYQCKVVEVDWGELDILVHYERWSNRFDEWLKMDSTRIRPLLRSSLRKEKKSSGPFRVGDKVTARWPADGKKYQAKVTKCLEDDQYEVLFFDGVAKVVRAGGLAKIESKSPRGSFDSTGGIDDPSTSSPRKQGNDFEDIMLLSPAGTTASSNDSQPSSPEPYPAKKGASTKSDSMLTKKSIFDVEIFEQKRKSKRKAAVEELFQSIKKRRKYEHSPPAKSQHSSQFDYGKKSARKRRSRSTTLHRDRGSIAGPSSKSLEGAAPQESIDRSTCESPMPLPSPNTIILDLHDGWKKCCVRRSHGNTAGKWDIYFVTPEGRKMRSKNDLFRYFEETGQEYDMDMFDFSVKNIRESAQVSTKEPKLIKASELTKEKEAEEIVEVEKEKVETDVKMKITIPIIPKTESISSLSADILSPSSRPWSPKPIGLQKSQSVPGDSVKKSIPTQGESAKKPVSTSGDSVKKSLSTPGDSTKKSLAAPGDSVKKSLSTTGDSIKKNVSTPGDSVTDEEKVVMPVAPPAVSTLSSAGGPSRPVTAPARQKHVPKKEPVLAPNEFVVKPQHNEHKCPKSGCLKSFRKENLLQMHIKHYHPDILKKGSNIAPNVADLAYARTVGDHLDVNISPTHASPPLEKTIKTESAGKKGRTGLFGNPGEIRLKAADKKSHGPSGSLASVSALKSSKESKKKEIKIEPGKGKPASDEESDTKEELDEYCDDLDEGEEVPIIGLHIEDPDYVPCEGDLNKKKERRDRKRTRGDSKTRKRKSVPSESMSEDDTQESKAVTKYRYSKRKGQPSSKPSVSSSTVAELGAPGGSTSSNIPAKKVQNTEESLTLEVEEDTTDTWGEGGENASVQEAPQEIINCGCGSTEEEGLMLQCDVCLCWQHGACYNIIGEDQVPDKYICSLCDHPRLERSAHKFRHHQDWLKEGRLPRFSFSRTRGDARLESCVRRGHELTANVLQLSNVLHSLRLKLHIAKEADHPKFVMWHKKWNEKEETDEVNNAATISGNTEAMERIQDLMDIVGDEGSSLPNPSITNSIITDPQLLAAAIESVAASDISQATPTNTLTNQLSDGFQVASLADSSTRPSNVHSNEKGQPIFSEPRATEPFSGISSKEEQQPSNIGSCIKEECMDIDLIKTEKSVEPSVNQPDGTLTEVDSKFGTCSDIKTERNVEEGQGHLENTNSVGSIPFDNKQNITKEKQESINLKPEVEFENFESDNKLQEASGVCRLKDNDSITSAVKEEGSAEVSPPVSSGDTVDVDGSLNTTSTPHSEVVSSADQMTKSEDTEETEEESRDVINKEDEMQVSNKNLSQDVKPEASLDVVDKDKICEPKDSVSLEKDSLDEPGALKESPEMDIKLEDKSKDVIPVESITGTQTSTEEKESVGSGFVKEEHDKSSVDSKDATAMDDVDFEAKVLDAGIQEDTSKASSSFHTEALSGINQSDIKNEMVKAEVSGTDDLDELGITDVDGRDLDDIELPQPEDLNASDLTHPEDLEGTDDVLDDDDANLEDGDDLALDLGGLEGSGDGGMPENSDLAALLSSHTELEQLVTQATSALASHVPVSAAQSIAPPIIPEAERIEPVNCKLNLLEHVQVVQSNITRRFDQIEKQLEVLEAEMGLSGDITEDEGEEESEERDPATLQARSLIKLILNDISTVKKISEFTN